jgi:hypothetical protein
VPFNMVAISRSAGSVKNDFVEIQIEGCL